MSTDEVQNYSKVWKLTLHQKNYSEDDLLINETEFPNVKENDIVEIYKVDDNGPRLLLQVRFFNSTRRDDSYNAKGTISVEQSIAAAFQFKSYDTVNVQTVDPADVTLDSIELVFKDQYVGRSEMWRLKNSLNNKCLYSSKKIEFCSGVIRCQVYEMWAKGTKVACGLVTATTKIVFRSLTAMVYIFIQMSSEMWDFDVYGDLYFEKAVNGFLNDLFLNWKKSGSNHEVTIVMFSRIFYDAKSINEFPSHMHDCLQTNYRGQFYEDYYRVIVQNERYDDWSPVLEHLRQLFIEYKNHVLLYHTSALHESKIRTPNAANSRAMQGNFLEVLNMALNVFEKHYLERSLDRTGQLSIVITPGVGVYEVDRELTNVTKQRIIDNGVGCDLVCVGEQPLHAVPLLKFHNKDKSMSVPDDYAMPHWINLSFYSVNKNLAYSKFSPRIKLPPSYITTEQLSDDSSPYVSFTISNSIRAPKQGAIKKCMESVTFRMAQAKQDELMQQQNGAIDYDAYDAQVFQLSTPPLSVIRGPIGTRGSSRMALKKHSVHESPHDLLFHVKNVPRKMSDPDIHYNCAAAVAYDQIHNVAKSSAIQIPFIRPRSSAALCSDTDSKDHKLRNKIPEISTTTSSDYELSLVSDRSSLAGSPPISLLGIRPGRPLINPFDPTHVTIKLTSNRRRWAHVFPKGEDGCLIQSHHYLVSNLDRFDSKLDAFKNDGLIQRTVSHTTIFDHLKKRNNIFQSKKELTPSQKVTLLWGATGEQDWSPFLMTGVDWKSLTMPACLPITTDYFPDTRALQNDYVVSDYNLLPDDVNADMQRSNCAANTNYRKPLTTKEVYDELISQRLAQGFQIIIVANTETSKKKTGTHYLISRSMLPEQREVYFLSIGRIFHKISLYGSAITVTRYRPRHPYPPFFVHYKYRFHSPYHQNYEISSITFTTEKLEQYNWNYLDHYICTRGGPDNALYEALKFWRFRIYIIPLNNPATKQILETNAMANADNIHNCDIYSPQTQPENAALVESFLKFVEVYLNKVKRPSTYKKPRASISVAHSVAKFHLKVPRRYSMSVLNSKSKNSNSASSPFRERVGSNRLIERHRPRSGSQREKGRMSPASDQVFFAETIIAPVEDVIEDSSALATLKSDCTLLEIAAAMKNNVPFVSNHSSYPKLTFVSADAVHWLITNCESVSNVEQAITLMTQLIHVNYVRHSSGSRNFPFIYGFYLYYFVEQEKNTVEEEPNGNLEQFQNEWMEVEIREPQAVFPYPPFLFDNDELQQLLQAQNNLEVSYKSVHLESDAFTKSERAEWGHGRYQTVYRPDQPYELVVQWMASTGAIVSELIFNWNRKAQSCGLQIIPIPSDVLSLPFTNKSDPLRSPIFVPLNIDALKMESIQEFTNDSYWPYRLFLLQEAIITKFGFLSCPSEKKLRRVGNQQYVDNQYVHCSGNVFVWIPSENFKESFKKTDEVDGGILTKVMSVDDGRRITRKLKRRTRAVSENFTSSVTASSNETKSNSLGFSPSLENIASLETLDENLMYNYKERVGFLWSWNHMFSKRWRSSSTPAAGDDAFTTKLLKNFREFCGNVDNRLVDYWNDCYHTRDQLLTDDDEQKVDA